MSRRRIPKLRDWYYTELVPIRVLPLRYITCGCGRRFNTNVRHTCPYCSTPQEGYDAKGRKQNR
jgi:hypothetical protein